MKLLGLRIRNLRSIETLDTDVPAHGLIAMGGNGIGKTSLLKAVAYAVGAEKLDTDAIRIGADRAEIVLDFDELVARRTITRKGTETLTITDAQGVERKRPATVLREMLGPVALLDPLALVAMKGAERREKVLAALPISTSTAELRRWAPDLPEGFEVGANEHGLDAVKRAHAALYDRRKGANAEAERTAEDLRRAQAAAAAVRPTDPTLTLAAAEGALTTARARFLELQAQENAARAYAEKAAGARARIEGLRSEAADLWVEDAVIDGACEAEAAALREGEALDVEIRALEVQLAKLKARQSEATRQVELWQKRASDHAAARARSESLRKQADEREAELAGMAPAAPSPADVQAALEAATAAERRVEDARVSERARELGRAAAERETAARAAAALAERLDEQVKALAKDAPRALLARADGIDGLEVRDDDVAISGVAVPKLCGSEQLFVCTQIAKRVTKCKLLLCDGLEALDEESLREFVEYATEDGWVLIGTRVSGGELVLADPERAVA